jgi:glycosyltransferase involved in cell wall biosynthesis
MAFSPPNSICSVVSAPCVPVRIRAPEICRELGCRVYHMTWPDSFSAARNESLKYARGEWIVWIDSDDVIDEENGRMMRELLTRGVDEKIFGLTMQVHCPAAGRVGDFDFTVVDHCKIFRNRPDIRFESRIHEQVLGAIRRAGGDAAYTPYFVVHAGADQTPAGRRRKLVRDFKLLRPLPLRRRVPPPPSSKSPSRHPSPIQIR